MDESSLPWSRSQSDQSDRQQINDIKAKNSNRVLTKMTWGLKKGSNEWVVNLVLFRNFTKF